MTTTPEAREAWPRARLRSALLVEDCHALHRPLQQVLREFAAKVDVAATCADAAKFIDERDDLELLVLDVCLPDGTGLEVLDLVRRRTALPSLVAISGESDAATAFELAQRGVREFVTKPIRADDVRKAIARALTAPPDLTLHLRASVGRVPIHNLEKQVRETMLDEALAQAAGNRRAAARLLSISRQLLQHMIRLRT